MADLLALPRTAESSRNGSGFNGKLNMLGLPKRKGWFVCHKVSICQEPQSRFCREEREQNHQSKSPNREMGEGQTEREPHLAKKRRIRAEVWS